MHSAAEIVIQVVKKMSPRLWAITFALVFIPGYLLGRRLGLRTLEAAAFGLLNFLLIVLASLLFGGDDDDQHP